MAYQKLQVSRAAAVTPSDSDNIPNIADSANAYSKNNGCVLYVGVGGNVKVLTAGGDEVTFQNLNNGQFVPVQVVKVFATDTTATGLIALW